MVGVKLCNRLVLGWSRRSGRRPPTRSSPSMPPSSRPHTAPASRLRRSAAREVPQRLWIAAELARLAMTPDSPTWEPNIEVLVVSASFEQSRILLGMVRASMGERAADYSWLDSGQRLACTHKATGTKLRVLSSSGKRAMGLSQFHTIFADEPASWEVRGGALMFDALRQSLGKRPGQRLFLIGTRAPALPHTWWPDLLDAGSGPGKHVQVLTAPAGEPWDTWDTIAKVNPVATVSESLRATILRERDEARRNPTMRRAFEAYRLNRPADAHSEVLVNLGDWQRAVKRDVPPRVGLPIVGIDMGAERSWSAASVTAQRQAVQDVMAACGLPSALHNTGDGTAAREGLRRWTMGTMIPLLRILCFEIREKLEGECSFIHDTYGLDMVGRAKVYTALRGVDGFDDAEARRLAGIDTAGRV